MRKKRPKYKVRRQRGLNAMRRRWKRTERSNKKWKLKKTGRRVRKSRKVKRRTALNASTNSARRGGSPFPRKGKLKIWLTKKRRGRKARRRRYGAAGDRRPECVAARVKERTEQRKHWRKCSKPSLKAMAGHRVKQPSGQLQGIERRQNQRRRTGGREHGRGRRERRAEIRRWRTGRVPTRGEGRQRRERGGVIFVGAGKRGTLCTESKQALNVGDGRQIVGESWNGRKKTRDRGQFNQGRRSLAWIINGRSGRGYVIVDYRTGTRRVWRRPRTGEVRRPMRRERSRWIRRG
jgi:hypothetical protein